MIWLLYGILISLSLGGLINHLVVQSKWASAFGNKNFMTFLIGVVSLHGVSFLLILTFVSAHSVSLATAFGFHSPRRLQALGLAVLVAAIALPMAWWLGQVSALVMEWFHVAPQEQIPVQTLRATEAPGQKVFFAVMAIGFVPFVEELLFRGILYPTVKQRIHPVLALWGTALIFAGIHLNVVTFVPLTVLAVLLTWLYERTDNLLAPILTHSLFNAANYYWLVTQPQAN